MSEGKLVTNRVPSFRLAVLVTCHNRREVTLTGLRSVHSALSEIPGVCFKVFLTDDGCTDGTQDAVAAEFPSVHVVPGSGDLYWAGGMAAAYVEARRARYDCDAYLLFNDDVRVRAGATRTFVEEFRQTLNDEQPSLFAGGCVSADESFTYGGYRRVTRYKALGFAAVFCGDESREIDTFNGNFVLIPAKTYESLGGLDAEFRHGYADLDLGLRARALGAKIFVSSAPVGECERSVGISHRARGGPRRKAFVLLFSGPHGMAPFVRFACRHSPPPLVPFQLLAETATRLLAVMRCRRR